MVIIDGKKFENIPFIVSELRQDAPGCTNISRDLRLIYRVNSHDLLVKYNIIFAVLKLPFR